MSKSRLWLRVAPDGSLEWLARDAQGRLSHGPQAWDGQQELAWPRVEERVLVWADEALVLRRAPLPAAARGRWRQGLPYLAEDWVAGDVAELQVCAPARLSGDRCWVAVVERERLAALLERMQQGGMDPDRVIPEAAFLGPGRPADVLVEGAHASFASEAGLAGSCELDLLPMIAGQPLESLRLLSAGGSSELRADPVDSALRWLSLQALDDSLVDLRQGAFATVRQAGVHSVWWRAAAWVLLTACVLHLLLLGAEVLRLRGEQAQLRAEVAAEFQRVFGADARMVDPVFQIRGEYQRLADGGGGGGDALAMLAGLAPVLASDPRLVLVGFEYRERVLELAVRAPDATRFDELREQMRLDRSLSVEVGSTQYDGDGFTGRLRLRRL